MQVCVAGWYFDRGLFGLLPIVNKIHPVFVVANRDHLILRSNRLRSHVRENAGLEFGAYDWFLKHEWNGHSPVLFQHDDVKVEEGVGTYNVIADMGKSLDHAFIFSSMEEAKYNRQSHGRAFYCSEKLLDILLREYGGFWYDQDNHGNVCDGKGVFNEAISRFRNLTRELGKKYGLFSGKYVIVPTFKCARRGQWKEPPFSGASYAAKSYLHGTLRNIMPVLSVTEGG